MEELAKDTFLIMDGAPERRATAMKPKRAKKKKQNLELNNYATACTFFSDVQEEEDEEEKSQVSEEENLSLSQYYDHVKFNILRRRDEGQTSIATLFTGVDIFEANEEDIPFYHFIHKPMKIFINSIKYESLDFNIWNKGLEGLAKGARRQLQRLIRMPIFDNFIMLTVIVNTIVMGLKGYVDENDTIIR